MSSAAPAVPDQPKPLSEVERVIDTFVAPTKTFADLRRSANWLVPWLLMSIVSIGVFVVADKKLGLEKVVENQMALVPKQAEALDKLPPEKRAQQMQIIYTWNRVLGYASPVMSIVILAIISGVLLASFNFGLGAELNYRQCLAISMYASLPFLLKGLIAMLLVGLGAGDAFTFQNPVVASNLGVLVEPTSHFLYSVATSIDVFQIWVLVLAGVGFSCMTMVKREICLAVVFGWWAILVFGGATIGAIFS